MVQLLEPGGNDGVPLPGGDRPSMAASPSSSSPASSTSSACPRSATSCATSSSTVGEELRIDLSGVEFIDSTGLGALVWAWKQSRMFRMRFLVTTPSAEVARHARPLRSRPDLHRRVAPSTYGRRVVTHYDLVVLGAGSGNMIVDDRFADRRVAIVERDRYGGTCLNRGCIPSKMLVLPADVADDAADGARLQLRTRFDGVDWPALRDRIFGHLDDVGDGGRAYRERLPYVDAIAGTARFTGPKTLRVALTDGGDDRDQRRPDRDRHRHPAGRARHARAGRRRPPHQRHRDAHRGAAPPPRHPRRRLRGLRARARVRRPSAPRSCRWRPRTRCSATRTTTSAGCSPRRRATRWDVRLRHQAREREPLRRRHRDAARQRRRGHRRRPAGGDRTSSEQRPARPRRHRHRGRRPRPDRGRRAPAHHRRRRLGAR